MLHFGLVVGAIVNAPLAETSYSIEVRPPLESLGFAPHVQLSCRRTHSTHLIGFTRHESIFSLASGISRALLVLASQRSGAKSRKELQGMEKSSLAFLSEWPARLRAISCCSDKRMGRAAVLQHDPLFVFVQALDTKSGLFSGTSSTNKIVQQASCCSTQRHNSFFDFGIPIWSTLRRWRQ